MTVMAHHNNTNEEYQNKIRFVSTYYSYTLIKIARIRQGLI